MKPEDLRAYMRRDWSRLEELKRSRWRERRRKGGPAANMQIAGEIYAHVRRADPLGPSEESRRDDLVHHQQLTAMLRACSGRKSTR